MRDVLYIGWDLVTGVAGLDYIFSDVSYLSLFPVGMRTIPRIFFLKHVVKNKIILGNVQYFPGFHIRSQQTEFWEWIAGRKSQRLFLLSPAVLENFSVECGS